MSRIACAFVVIVVVALAAPGRAFADDKRQQASELARRAVALYEVGRYGEALDEFEQAYILYPTDALLFNLAQSHRKLEHCRQAVDLYRRLLDRYPDSTRVPAVRRLLPTLERACAVKDQAPSGVQVEPSRAIADGGSVPASASAPLAPPPPPVAAALPLERVAAATPVPAAVEATPVVDAAVAEVVPGPPRRARMVVAATVGGLAAGGASVAPLGAMVSLTLPTRSLPVELGATVGVASFAWAHSGHRGTSTVIAALVTAGRSTTRGRVDLHLDAGAGITVLAGIPASHPLLASGRRVDGGVATVPQLEVLARGERALGGGWSGGGGVRLGAAYGGAAFGGTMLSFTALIGIGRRL